MRPTASLTNHWFSRSRLRSTHTWNQLVVTHRCSRPWDRSGTDSNFQASQNHGDGFNTVWWGWCSTHQSCRWYSASRPLRSTVPPAEGWSCTSKVLARATTNLLQWLLSTAAATARPMHNPQHQAATMASPTAPQGHPVGAKKIRNSRSNSGAQYAQLMRNLIPKSWANPLLSHVIGSIYSVRYVLQFSHSLYFENFTFNQHHVNSCPLFLCPFIYSSGPCLRKIAATRIFFRPLLEEKKVV